jgi:hypothetical protein
LKPIFAVHRALLSAARRRWRTHGYLTFLGVALAACYDPQQRCDPGEVLFADTRCVCDEGLVMSGNLCVPCGDNEVASSAGCVCADGYARASNDAPCETKPGGQGDACDNQTPCAISPYTYCQSTAGSAGYCTTEGCSGSADCSGGYACNTSAAPAFCQRPPVGAGKTCASDADCAGTDATYCDVFQTHACLVQGCTLSADNCFQGTKCCDLSSYGVPQPLCLALETCP